MPKKKTLSTVTTLSGRLEPCPTCGLPHDKRAEQCRACAYKRRTLDEPVRAARLRAQRRWWRDNRARVPVQVRVAP
jgi:hypothetical protein